MPDLKSLDNEIRFFETLNAGIEAFKAFSHGEAKSFDEAIRKVRHNIVASDEIPHNKAILAKSLIGLSLIRRLFIMAVRERADYIDFEGIANTKEYQELRDKLLKNDPSLTQVECHKILKQFCNAIAHGDVIKSFNFDKYEQTTKEIYKKFYSLSPINLKRSMDLSYALDKSSSLLFNYESNFEIGSDGTRVKRPTPVKFQVEMTSVEMFNLLNLVCKNEITKKVYYFINENLYAGMIDLDTKEKTEFEFDEVQKEALNQIKNDYLSRNLNLPVTEETKLQYALIIGLQRVLMGQKFLHIKINDISNSAITLPRSEKDLKKTEDEIMNYVSAFAKKISGHPINSFGYEQMKYNTKLTNIYKNLLTTQIVNMLEEIEQLSIKVKTAKKSKVIREIACELFEKEEVALDDKDLISIIDNIRNAFVHGSYINLPDDRIEIYDQKTKKDKQLEHKFTLDNSDMEEIKDACLYSLKELRKELSPTIPTTPKKNQPERTI